jgi:hypothetical protein
MKRNSDKTDLPPAYEDDMPQDSRRDTPAVTGLFLCRTTNFKAELLIFQVEHLAFCTYIQIGVSGVLAATD